VDDSNQLFADDPILGLFETKTIIKKLDSILHDRTAATGSGGLTIGFGELTMFLGTNRYDATISALLTDLHDSKTSRWGSRTVTGGTVDQANIFVNLFSDSTPAWLRRSVNPKATEGGVTSRRTFVCSEQQPKRYFAWSKTKSGDTGALVCRLGVIRTQHRGYSLIVTKSSNPS
jgi:hypothetical protein